MEGRDEQQTQQHQGGLGQHQMHPQQIYGYPMDPAWAGQPMMHLHQMHPGHGYPHPLQHPMDGVPLPPGIPGLGSSTDPLEAVLGPFPCARLRSLPFDASLEDILVLFQGLVVIDVVLQGGGEAFVIFANPMDYQMALQRDRQTLGRNFVEIYSGSRSEYYAAVASQQWRETQRDSVLALGDSIFGGNDKDSKAGGGVWGSLGISAPIQPMSQVQQPQSKVEMGQNRPAPQSVPAPIGAAPGGKNAGPVSGGVRGNPSVAGQAAVKRTGGGIQIGEHTGFLRMRGLPFSSTKEDIFNFFKSYNPILDSIVLTYRSDGRATGEAYIGFESPEDSKRAMELHRKSMGSRYIELFLSNKEEHGRALVRFGNR